MLTSEPERRIAFRGAHNFRDLGGLPTAGGGVTRHGVVFRSDSLHGLAEQDVDSLVGRLGVRRLIDLRSLEESEAEPPAALQARGVEVVNLPISRGAGRAIVAGRDGLMLSDRYVEYVADHGTELARAVQLVSEPGIPTVFHCRLGKDRTGVLAALILWLLEVPEHDIVADYEATNEGLPLLLEALRASSLYAENVRRLPAEMYTSRAETMRGFLALMQERHETPSAWASSVGLTEDDLTRLRGHLVVGVPHEKNE